MSLRWGILFVCLGSVVLTTCKADNSGKAGDPCATQNACGPGLVCDCVTQTCQPIGAANPYCAPPDARAFEASVRDAAPDTAPRWDAAVDSASEDARTEDGASPDVALSDAAPPDGPLTGDAGSEDATP